MVKKGIFGVFIILILFGSGCRLTYLFHAASGQLSLICHAIPVDAALKKDTLSLEQRDRLLLVARIKEFGERELGLKKTQNYQTINLKSSQNPVYTVSASPKDRLERITWWFPVVGHVPYLGFFDLSSAQKEKKRLSQKDLDVFIWKAEAYSTLGWFNDPLTLNMIEGSTVDLAETILHEMTHTTLYLKGEGEFNEGLANLVGKMGAFLFMKKTYGPSHPFTIDAQKSLEDERIFSSYLSAFLKQLGELYQSPLSYQEKLSNREEIFSKFLKRFAHINKRLKTDRFTYFGRSELNNAYLMSIGLYHQHFHLFEAALEKNGESIRKMLDSLRSLAKSDGDIIEKMKSKMNPKPGAISKSSG